MICLRILVRDLDMNPKEKLEAAVLQPDPAWALRHAVEELANDGCARDEVIRNLDYLLTKVRSESPVNGDSEDAILDAYDGIYEWCHPSAWVDFATPVPDRSREEMR